MGEGLAGNHFYFFPAIRPGGGQAVMGGTRDRVFIDTDGRGKEAQANLRNNSLFE